MLKADFGPCQGTPFCYAYNLGLESSKVEIRLESSKVEIGLESSKVEIVPKIRMVTHFVVTSLLDDLNQGVVSMYV